MDKLLKTYQAEESKPDIVYLWSIMPEINKKYYNNCIDTYASYKLQSIEDEKDEDRLK